LAGLAKKVAIAVLYFEYFLSKGFNFMLFGFREKINSNALNLDIRNY